MSKYPINGIKTFKDGHEEYWCEYCHRKIKDNEETGMTHQELEKNKRDEEVMGKIFEYIKQNEPCHLYYDSANFKFASKKYKKECRKFYDFLNKDILNIKDRIGVVTSVFCIKKLLKEKRITVKIHGGRAGGNIYSINRENLQNDIFIKKEEECKFTGDQGDLTETILNEFQKQFKVKLIQEKENLERQFNSILQNQKKELNDNSAKIFNRLNQKIANLEEELRTCQDLLKNSDTRILKLTENIKAVEDTNKRISENSRIQRINIEALNKDNITLSEKLREVEKQNQILRSERNTEKIRTGVNARIADLFTGFNLKNLKIDGNGGTVEIN